MIPIDSNVLVAAVDDLHGSHAEALAIFATDLGAPRLIAAHSIAETYVTLTRKGGGEPVGWDANRAAALSQVSGAMLPLSA